MIEWEVVDLTPSARGGNSEVVCVRDRSGELPGLFARKTLLPTRLDKSERFRREVEVARALEHPGLVRVVHAHLPDSPSADDLPYAIMPWASAGRVRLDAYRGNWRAALTDLSPVLGGVAYLHGQGLAHRDIKPANILRFDDSLRLSDFGLCIAEDDERFTLSQEAVGSLGYRAPEYIGGRAEVRDHRPGDVYSLGKALWAFIAGVEAPEGVDLRFPAHNLVTRFGREVMRVQAFIQQMVSDARVRPVIDEVVESVEILLRGEQVTPPAQDGLAIAKALQGLHETHPSIVGEAAERDLRNAWDAGVVAALREVARIVEGDEELRKLRNAIPPAVGQVHFNGPTGGWSGEPLEAAAIEGRLGGRPDCPPEMSGRSFSVGFSSASSFVPMVFATWAFIPERSLPKCVFYTGVYVRYQDVRVPIAFRATPDRVAADAHAFVTRTLKEFMRVMGDIESVVVVNR